MARETAQTRWLAGLVAAEATLAGLRGDEATARELATAAERAIAPLGNNYILALIQFARGTAALGAGQHDDAYGQLRRMFDLSDIAYHAYIRCWAVAELAEAAARVEQRDEARQHVEELENLGAASWSPILDVGLRNARPLLAPDDEAEALFQESGPSARSYTAGLSSGHACSWHTASGSVASAVWLKPARRCAPRGRASTRSAPSHGASARARSSAHRAK